MKVKAKSTCILTFYSDIGGACFVTCTANQIWEATTSCLNKEYIRMKRNDITMLIDKKMFTDYFTEIEE